MQTEASINAGNRRLAARLRRRFMASTGQHMMTVMFAPAFGAYGAFYAPSDGGPMRLKVWRHG